MDTCSICGKPKRVEKSGTLTGWLFDSSTCSCGLKQPEQEAQAPEVLICTTCGKFIRTGRPGTLTQWILRSDSCSCNYPKPKELSEETSIRVSPTKGELEPIREEFDEEPQAEPDETPRSATKVFLAIASAISLILLAVLGFNHIQNIDTDPSSSEKLLDKPLPVETDPPDIIEFATSKEWTQVKGDGGIIWWKKSEIKDDDFKDPEIFKDKKNITLWQEYVSPQGYSYIKELKPEGLHLQETPLDDASLPIIGGMTTLKALYISGGGSKFTKKNLYALCALRNLEVFDIGKNSVTDDDLEFLKSLTNLETVFADHLKNVDGSFFKYLENLPKLDKLDVQESSFLPGKFAPVAKIKTLRVLYISGTKVDDSNMQEICSLPSLEALDITNTDVTQWGVEKLKALKKLKILFVDDPQISSLQKFEFERRKVRIQLGQRRSNQFTF